MVGKCSGRPKNFPGREMAGTHMHVRFRINSATSLQVRNGIFVLRIIHESS